MSYHLNVACFRAAAAAALLLGIATTESTAQVPDDTDSPRVGNAVADHAGEPRLVASPVRRPIRIDGVLDDAAWQDAQVGNGFTQQAPQPGAPSQFATDVRVVYDERAVYVAVRAQDPAPDSILALLARRDDGIQSDWLHVAFDSYGDRRSAYQFGVNPAGVKRDARITDDTSEDVAWDGVWDVATAVDAQGWIAEFRIPLSQLRYRTGSEAQPWGFNAKRVVPRAAETSYWAPVPNNAGTYVSSFGILAGLRPQRAARNVEIVPYIASGVQHDAVRAVNPYYSATNLTANAGVDVRMSVGSALTLRATANPDFGQVEADPSTVNLTAYEQYLPERRPFFVEGAEHFDLEGPRLFYSRRIGRAPQGRVTGADAVAMPTHATLLGALKLTGRSGGWSIGVLDALTAREHARYRNAEGENRAVVEPATNYAVASVARDFRAGRSGIGTIVTAVNRRMENGELPQLRTSAYAGGIEGRHRFGDDNYELRASVLGSHVLGDTVAIARTQRAAGHYFQRPDADHLTYDPGRRTLSGLSARAALHKVAGGNWRAGVNAHVTTPGFEINDLGFFSANDQIRTSASLRYLQHQPGTLLNRWSLSVNQGTLLTTGGERIDATATAELTGTLHNQWEVGFWGMRHLGGLQPSALRGGPALFEPGTWMGSINLQTDRRRSVAGSIRLFGHETDQGESARTNISGALHLRPSARLEATVQPSFSRMRTKSQYVTRQQVAGEPVYILGTLEQHAAALRVRLNYAFTPTMSLQLYAQPYLSAGTFSAFRRVVNPRAADPGVRFQELAEPELVRTSVSDTVFYAFDADGDASPEIRWRDPSFNFRQMRSNVVFRWEFRPGSTLFLVWTRETTDDARSGSLRAGRDMEQLLRAQGPQALMIKMTYWLAL